MQDINILLEATRLLKGDVWGKIHFRALVIVPMAMYSKMYELCLCKSYSESHVYGTHLFRDWSYTCVTGLPSALRQQSTSL